MPTPARATPGGTTRTVTVDRIRERVTDLEYETYEDNAGEHRRRQFGGNGRVIADSGEGEDTQSGARDGLKSVKRDLSNAAAAVA